MPLSPQTLMMAVQAVHAEMTRLTRLCEETDGPEVADLEDLLQTYELASVDLRTTYIAAWREAGNLPPYETLIGLAP